MPDTVFFFAETEYLLQSFFILPDLFLFWKAFPEFSQPPQNKIDAANGDQGEKNIDPTEPIGRKYGKTILRIMSQKKGELHFQSDHSPAAQDQDQKRQKGVMPPFPAMEKCRKMWMDKR